MRGSLLTLNAGSSSLKFAVFRHEAEPRARLRGEVSDLGTSPRLVLADYTGTVVAERRWRDANDGSFAAVLDSVLTHVDRYSGVDPIAAVGHRVVHGGPDYGAPERVTPALITALTALTPLDPIHMPHNLAPIAAIAKVWPRLPQFVSFDTAFHRTMPDVARNFAIPRDLTEAGVRRYGFHGLSYEYIAQRLAADPFLAGKRVLVAHLGAGASLCALDAGVSIATTFGLSVLDGLMMATRCGSIDPGALLYMARTGSSLTEIEDTLYHRSGLLGVSGTSGDIRVLIDSDDPRAREAIDLFTYRIALDVGALTSALGGLDGLVFTAGIGEHSPAIRAAVCDRLAWLGVDLDHAANARGDARISAAGSGIDVRVIATDEDAMIAAHVLALIRDPTPALDERS